MTIQRINNGKGHWYKLDGKKADGVTTLIGNGVPKPALIGWAARRVATFVAENMDAVIGMRDMGVDAIVDALRSRPFHESTAAAVRGTHVHGYAERLGDGEDVDVPPELAGYVQACADFLDDWGIEPILRETVVASRAHGYCGTLDLVADCSRGHRAIFDYKTSASGIYGETALQECAYLRADCYVDSDGVEHAFDAPLCKVLDITHAYAVQLRPDGYDVYPLDVSDATFELFLHAAAVGRSTAKTKTWGGLAELVGDPVVLNREAATP